jgi:hypothetical protein
VFFDAAGIEYAYEPEGFVVEGGRWYLPDFYLPQFQCYAEVKPVDCLHCVLEHEDFEMWRLFAKNKPLLIMYGSRPHNSPNLLLRLYYDRVINDEAGFHYETKGKNGIGWRFWTGCSGDETFDDLDSFVIAANKARFEHNH